MTDHGTILKGSTEYKAVARSAPDSGLASDFVAGAKWLALYT
jgi:hypothetical protein